MNYLNWLKLLAALLLYGVLKPLDRVWVAMGWGFGLTFGFYLFQALLNVYIPVPG